MYTFVSDLPCALFVPKVFPRTLADKDIHDAATICVVAAPKVRVRISARLANCAKYKPLITRAEQVFQNAHVPWNLCTKVADELSLVVFHLLDLVLY